MTLEQKCTRKTATAQINFGHTMQIHSGGGRAWAQMVRMLYDQACRPDSILREPMIGLPFIDSLVRGLLVVADHPYRSAVVKPVRPLRSRLVETAVEIIEADAHLPLTVSEIAVRGRGSVRALQQAFLRELETTPMAYLREVRLRRAHRALVEADPSVTTVASIASNWGFTNLGRFAETHAACYGESPVVTLRRTLFPLAKEGAEAAPLVRRANEQSIEPQAAVDADLLGGPEAGVVAGQEQTRSATSSGRPNRPLGKALQMRSWSVRGNVSIFGVAIIPGSTELAVIP